MESLHRFLEVASRHVGAATAHLQLGGEPDPDPARVSLDLEGAWRLVVRFEAPPADAELVRGRLEDLMESFPGIQAHADGVQSPVPTLAHEKRQALGEALETLAAITKATRAVVIDDDSPVIWGTSKPSVDLTDVRSARLIVGPNAPEAVSDDDRVAARAIALALDDPGLEGLSLVEDDFAVISKRFAGVYHLVMAFDGPVNEVVAEGTAIRALPVIERLTLAIPPLDPGPAVSGEGRVIPLRRV